VTHNVFAIRSYLFSALYYQMLRHSRRGFLPLKIFRDQKRIKIHRLGNLGKQFRIVTDFVVSQNTCGSFLGVLSAEEGMTSTCSVTLVLFVLIDTANRPARMISYSKRNYPRQIEAKYNDWRDRKKMKTNRKRINIESFLVIAFLKPLEPSGYYMYHMI
jgi:hypothetical protein